MYSVVLIVIMSVVTLCIRAFSFLVFNGKQALPSALECLKSVEIFSYPYGIPEAVSCIVIVVLQWWKENTILSVLAGTFLYMFLVQCLF